MGKRDVIDKTIKPEDIVRALQAGNLTIAQAQQLYPGMMLIGDYKGIAAILDLDLLVKQPLVDAERRHILGLLDGRLAGHDLVACTTVAAEAATAHIGQLTVPAGEVWFINNTLTTVPANCVGNWHCSLWTDPAAVPSVYGQPFHAVNLAAGVIQRDEFCEAGGLWLITNKTVEIRAPAGTIFTFVMTSVPVVGLVTGTFQLYGWVGKALVD